MTRKWIAALALAASFGMGPVAHAKKRRPPARVVKKVQPPARAATPAPAATENAEPAEPTPAFESPPPRAAAPSSTPTTREVVQRESKIEFDERAIQGQTAAGAIYLFQRGESDFKSMIEVPDSFRQRTIRQILPEQQQPPQAAARVDSKP